MERRRLRAGAIALPALLGLLVAGCGEPVTEQACISWVSADDDASRTELADVVVEGRPVERVGERSMFGVDAAVWRVEVDRVFKGAAEPGTSIDVASTPRTCETGGPYPEGDPLDTTGPVRLYLSDSEAGGTEPGLALVTPFDGVGTASG
ncbi:hypothetical protein AA0Y32_05460 [Georgenia phoenicis]|uniref:hypothetical protein n=1 Tax=unclassified Georgenia TaxID=2626815 RepID=UPI0039B12025